MIKVLDDPDRIAALQLMILHADAGEARLDEKIPNWWQEGRIDTDNLFMASLTMCLLAQLHDDSFTMVLGGSAWGATAEFLGDDVFIRPGDFGFDLHADALHITFEDLAEEWISRIMRRRANNS